MALLLHPGGFGVGGAIEPHGVECEGADQSLLEVVTQLRRVVHADGTTSVRRLSHDATITLPATYLAAHTHLDDQMLAELDERQRAIIAARPRFDPNDLHQAHRMLEAGLGPPCWIR